MEALMEHQDDAEMRGGVAFLDAEGHVSAAWTMSGKEVLRSRA